MLSFLLLLGCHGGEARWAVAEMSARPGAQGVEGTQVWSFFTKGWGGAEGERAYVCSEAQSFVGSVVAAPEGCEGCVVAYDIAYEPLDGDCADGLGHDDAFRLPSVMGVGDPPAAYSSIDPQPGHSLGWYADLGTGVFEIYGFAWDAALDEGDADPGPPGWNSGQIYTLLPVVAWDLQGA